MLAPVADASLAHVLGRLELIEARVRAAVARRKAVDPDIDDRFRGLYVSPAHVERLLSRNGPTPAPDEATATVRIEIEAQADLA
ncbi:MAG TPA: ATP-binding protein, partial [Candidatus Dormibacteraeota bacterium]|nr:ATP-binding protein [Candidatus Dormibacteraeota bacterium]